MGPSGSGKSTLMHLLAALDSPTSGSVYIGDVNVATLRDAPLTKLRRDSIGFIFQAFNLVPTLTARENIVLPVTIAGKRVDNAWFDRIVEVLGLGPRLNHKPFELSGGQQQRVACARALMNRPQIIFADEPTGNLDSTSAIEVLEFLRRSVDEFNQTVVMVTHDALAASYADSAVFLSDGRIVEIVRGASQEELLHAISRIYPRQRSERPKGDSFEQADRDLDDQRDWEPQQPAEMPDDHSDPDPGSQITPPRVNQDPASQPTPPRPSHKPTSQPSPDPGSQPTPPRLERSIFRDGGHSPYLAPDDFPIETDLESTAARRAIRD
jgi:putative transport protein of outer membrane lipoproteins (ABC superfamily, atp_bind) (partial match)